MVMSVGGRDGGSGGTPHRENVPTHRASLVGRTPAWANNLLHWIGFEQLGRSIGLNSLGLEPSPTHGGGLEQSYQLDWVIWSGSSAILKQRVEQL